jgi:hypothetical protein
LNFKNILIFVLKEGECSVKVSAMSNYTVVQTPALCAKRVMPSAVLFQGQDDNKDKPSSGRLRGMYNTVLHAGGILVCRVFPSLEPRVRAFVEKHSK